MQTNVDAVYRAQVNRELAICPQATPPPDTRPVSPTSTVPVKSPKPSVRTVGTPEFLAEEEEEEDEEETEEEEEEEEGLLYTVCPF